MPRIGRLADSLAVREQLKAADQIFADRHGYRLLSYQESIASASGEEDALPLLYSTKK